MVAPARPVIALAGRRIDAAGASPVRFPRVLADGEDNVARVRELLRQRFSALGARAIVSSAACGVDLLGLEAAGMQGMDRTIVLPFDPGEFRKTSVVDRGEEWGPPYDRIVAEVAAADGLVVLGGTEEGDAAYARVNDMILDRALRLAMAATERGGDPSLVAFVVWDGVSRGAGDLTEQFAVSADRRARESRQPRRVSVEVIRTDRREAPA